MFSQMSVQIGLLAKTALTEMTFVRFLFVVNVSDMALQVGRDGEGALAELALVRLLPSVGA